MSEGGILLAGGSGTRMQGLTDDKILHVVNRKPVFLYSIETFVASGLFAEIVIVYRDKSQRRTLESIVQTLDYKTLPAISWTMGGAERMHSVMKGLRAFQNEPEQVFIHDCARPAIGTGLVLALAKAALEHGAACAAQQITDTIKRTDGKNPAILENLPRKCLWGMETPQVFRHKEIYEGYEMAETQGIHVTDDTTALALTGRRVCLVESPRPNPKLTTPADLAWLEFLLKEED